MKVSKIIEVPGLENRIKEARTKDERSVGTLAEIAGITRAQWHNIEKGDIKILPWETLLRIQRALGIEFLDQNN